MAIDGPRAVVTHPVVDAFAIAAVDLHAGDDRVAGERLDRVVIPLARDCVRDAVVTTRAARVR